MLLAAVAQPQKNVSVPWLKFSYGLLGLLLRAFTPGPVLGVLDSVVVKRPLFCTAGIPGAGKDGKVQVVQFNLSCLSPARVSRWL